MALKATIFKVELQIADMDRNYYADHALTIARHPSETDERMMVRLLAFAMHADKALTIAKGLGADDEPDLWQRDLTGAIDVWIDVGQPDEKRIRRACGRAAQVVVYSYSGHSADIWWNQLGARLERIRNLGVVNLPAGTGPVLAKLAGRGVQLQCAIQDGHVWTGGSEEAVPLELQALKRAGSGRERSEQGAEGRDGTLSATTASGATRSAMHGGRRSGITASRRDRPLMCAHVQEGRVEFGAAVAALQTENKSHGPGITDACSGLYDAHRLDPPVCS